MALISLSVAALADGKFQRETDEFPAGDRMTRQVIDVGGCKETGEVSELSLMKIGPFGRVPAALILHRVQVRFADASTDTVLQSDNAFYMEFFRLKQPCVSQIILDGRSVEKQFRVRAELD